MVDGFHSRDHGDRPSRTFSSTSRIIRKHACVSELAQEAHMTSWVLVRSANAQIVRMVASGKSPSS